MNTQPEELEIEVSKLYCNTFTQCSDWVGFIKNEIRKAEENMLKDMKVVMAEWHGTGKAMVEDYAERKRINLEALKK